MRQAHQVVVVAAGDRRRLVVDRIREPTNFRIFRQQQSLHIGEVANLDPRLARLFDQSAPIERTSEIGAKAVDQQFHQCEVGLRDRLIGAATEHHQMIDASAGMDRHGNGHIRRQQLPQQARRRHCAQIEARRRSRRQ